MTQTEGQGAAEDENVFVHGDPLGPSNTIIAKNGTVEESLYYSAGGARLDEQGAPQNDNPYAPVTIGFAGHEHDDELSQGG